jgi:hypothetical protein
MVLTPLKVTLSHVNTVAKMREVLENVAGLQVPEALLEVGTPYQACHGPQISNRFVSIQAKCWILQREYYHTTCQREASYAWLFIYTIIYAVQYCLVSLYSESQRKGDEL